MINHKIENNKIVFRVKLSLRKKPTDQPIVINRAIIEKYIKENDIEVGEPINTTQIAGNWKREFLEAEWTYRIPKRAKKVLTVDPESATIDSKRKRKQKPSRSRARQIAASKRAIKEQIDDNEHETKKAKPRRTRRPRKKTEEST